LKKRCYMCSSIATTDEHVPPQAVFPKAKDFDTEPKVLRNLITVPSCDRHNTKKSGSDEYIAYAIIVHFQNNADVLPPLIRKMARASSRNSLAIRQLIDGATPVLFDGRETVAVKIDLICFHKSFEHMTKALYFNEFQSRWPFPIATVSSAFKFIDEPNARLGNTLVEQLGERCKRYFAPFDFNFKGQNPQYFKYQIMPLFTETGKELIMRLVFYEGLEVYTLSKEKWQPDELEIMRPTDST